MKIVNERAEWGQSFTEYQEDRREAAKAVKKYLRTGTLFHDSRRGGFVGKCDKEKVAKIIARNKKLGFQIIAKKPN